MGLSEVVFSQQRGKAKPDLYGRIGKSIRLKTIQNRRGPARSAESSEQILPVPFSEDGFWIGSKSGTSSLGQKETETRCPQAIDSARPVFR
jgi:hypothetical protein